MQQLYVSETTREISDGTTLTLRRSRILPEKCHLELMKKDEIQPEPIFVSLMPWQVSM